MPLIESFIIFTDIIAEYFTAVKENFTPTKSKALPVNP